MYFIRLVCMCVTVISMSIANDINLNQLVVEAKKTNKHILVFLHIPGCHYCLNMQEFTFDDEKVKAAIKKDFIFVDINVKDDGVVKYDDIEVSKFSFAKKMGYPIYPTCLFFDKNGELVYDGVGFRDEKQFLYMLKLVSSYSYSNEDKGWDE